MRGSLYTYCAHGADCPDRAKRGHVKHGYRVDLAVGPDGKRRQQRQGGYARKADAQRALSVALAELASGVHQARSALTVAGYLESWLEGKGKIRESTAHAYRGHLTRYIIPAVGHLRLEDLRAPHLEAMYREMSARGLSPATVARCHATVRSALNSALRRGLVARNVSAHVELPSVPRYVAQVWSPAEVGSFLDVLEDSGDRLAALYRLLVLRGLRRGEAVGLRWTDVDLDAGTATISQAVGQVGYRTVVTAPKTAGSIRTVGLDGGTVAALRAHRIAQAAERLAFGGVWQDVDNRVFTRPDGRPLHPESVSRAFERIAAAAGLPRIRLHDLRHSAATLALEANVPMKVVSSMLGHSSTRLTSDVYSHVRNAVALEAAEATVRLVPRRPRTG